MSSKNMPDDLILDHSSPSYSNAKMAEEKLLALFGLKARDKWINNSEEKLRIRISEIGEGEPAFVIPGNTGDSYPFIPLVSKLEGYHFYLFNRPGGGLSDGFDHERNDLREFVINTIDAVFDELGIESISLLSHSMGSHWALWYAMARPLRVKKIVVIGNPGRVMLDSAPIPIKILLWPGVDSFAFKFLVSENRKKDLTGLKKMGINKSKLDDISQEYKDCIYYFQHLPHYKTASLSLLRAFNKDDRNAIKEDELGALNVPVQMLWGEKDTFADVDKGREISRAIPNCQFELIKDAGHMPWIDGLDICAEKIKDFL